MLIAGLSSFGWLYLKAKWTDIALREQTLFDQAKVIAGYLRIDGNNSIISEFATAPSRGLFQS